MGEYALLLAAIVAGYALSPRFQQPVLVNGGLEPSVVKPAMIAALCMFIGVRVAAVGGRWLRPGSIEQNLPIALGALVGLLTYQLVFALSTATLVDRYVHLIAYPTATCLLIGFHFISRQITRRYGRTVMFCGSAECYRLIKRIHTSSGPQFMTFLGRYDLPLQMWCPESSESGGRAVPLHAIAIEMKPSHVLAELPNELPQAAAERLLEMTALGFSVMEVGIFIERYHQRVLLRTLHDRWFWGYDPAHAHPYFTTFKRFIDVVISCLGLLVLAPIAPLLFILIKVQDGGPIFYSQLRTGLGGKVFEIYKLRTMRVDAEKSGARWARQNDGRTTGIGRFLRKCRLDETPQFWNIIRGDMSFIGPRPERPEMIQEIEKEIPYYRYRHLVKPGLSGWAQVNYPYGSSIDDARHKLEFDLYYIKFASITLDFAIAIRTVVAMVKGAR